MQKLDFTQLLFKDSSLKNQFRHTSHHKCVRNKFSKNKSNQEAMEIVTSFADVTDLKKPFRCLITHLASIFECSENWAGTLFKRLVGENLIKRVRERYNKELGNQVVWCILTDKAIEIIQQGIEIIQPQQKCDHNVSAKAFTQESMSQIIDLNEPCEIETLLPSEEKEILNEMYVSSVSEHRMIKKEKNETVHTNENQSFGELDVEIYKKSKIVANNLKKYVKGSYPFGRVMSFINRKMRKYGIDEFVNYLNFADINEWSVQTEKKINAEMMRISRYGFDEWMEVKATWGQYIGLLMAGRAPEKPKGRCPHYLRGELKQAQERWGLA